MTSLAWHPAGNGTKRWWAPPPEIRNGLPAQVLFPTLLGLTLRVHANVLRAPGAAVLAVGHEKAGPSGSLHPTGVTVLYDVETGNPVFRHTSEHAVRCLHWAIAGGDASKKAPAREYPDDVQKYFPDPVPPLGDESCPAEASSWSTDSARMPGGVLDVLTVGTDSGGVELFAGGVFPLGRLAGGSEGASARREKLSGVYMTSDLGHLLVTTHADGQEGDGVSTESAAAVWDVAVLREQRAELSTLARYGSHLLNNCSYLAATIHSMREVWGTLTQE